MNAKYVTKTIIYKLMENVNYALKNLKGAIFVADKNVAHANQTFFTTQAQAMAHASYAKHSFQAVNYV